MSKATPGIAAVRGAVSVRANTAASILEATERLLTELATVNEIDPERIVSIVFTATKDLDADFPAHAARRLGWDDVPLLSAGEIDVPGARSRVVRVLITVTGMRSDRRLRPVYLGEAAALRPDFADQLDAGSTSQDHGEPKRLAIIGLGQIGGSIGLALGRQSRWRRVGFDLDAGALERAHGAGAVDEVARSLEDACADAAAVVIAIPVDAVPAMVKVCAEALPKGATLLDTGSARKTITPALERAAARGLLAAGFHPLAGTEGTRFDSARANLFQGATIAIIPAAGAEVPLAETLAAAIGGHPQRVDAEDHDRALARTSHLPYLVAMGLAAAGRAFAARGLSGPGFRDMTRLAASEATMARAYCRANAEELSAAWQTLRHELDAQVRAVTASPTPPPRSP